MSSNNLMVRLYSGLDPKQRSSVFEAISHLRWVESVVDLSVISRDTLDEMLAQATPVRDPAEARNRGKAKIVYQKSEVPRQEPIPIKSLRERLGR